MSTVKRQQAAKSLWRKSPRIVHESNRGHIILLLLTTVGQTMWRAEASHGSSALGNQNSSIFLLQLGPVLFVRESTLLLPVQLSKQHLLWYGYDRKLDKYQEQGQLIEPYLESMVSHLMFIVRTRAIELGTDSSEILEKIKTICIIVYSLVIVCGNKATTKFFPHQVSDFELAVSLLEKFHATTSISSLRQESTGEMDVKCVILLWLSILVFVPFDISSMDSSVSYSSHLGAEEPPPLVLRILYFSKNYLSNASPMRTIAGLLLSRLLTLPDMAKAFSLYPFLTVKAFLFWLIEIQKIMGYLH